MVLQVPVSSGALEISAIDPRTDPAWRDLIGREDSSVFHSPRWMDVLHEAYSFDPIAYIAKRDGVPVAGVPVCLTDELVRKRYISLPFSDFCEVVGHDEQARRAVAEAVLRECRPWSLRSRTGRLPEIAAPATSSRSYFWHLIDTRPATEHIEMRLSKDVRRSIRRAERDGVKVVHAQSKDDLRAWFGLQLRLRKQKHGLLAQPYSFFEAIWDSMIAPGDGVLLLAYHDGQLIGGEIDLVWKDTLYAKFAAASLDHLKLRPNHILTWEAIRFAKSRGLAGYDLGRTSVSQQGLVDFKRSFNPHEEGLVSATYGEVGQASRHQKQLDEAIEGLSALLADKSVPDSVTERAGEILYRYFA